MSHTPEPWGITNLSSREGSMVVAPPRDVVHQAVRDGDLPITSRRIAVLEASHYTPADVCAANAARIAACVNALRGVPTEELLAIEPDALREVFDQWRRERNE